MQPSFPFLLLAATLALLVSCGGTKPETEALDVPTNMPEICRGIDFVAQPDMREVCGVRVSRYKGYKNIPLQRYLVYPKDASLVKSNGKVELRLPNTLPIYLDSATSYGLEFTQESRMQAVKNTMDYKELFPPGADRIKMFRLVIPKDIGGSSSLCFRVPDRQGNERTRSVAMGNQLESMTCADFDLLVAKYVR